ncbi:immunodominant staphylococcal antigen IsaB family protein [Staphylococcus caeli]|uniref:immunodominant staphylococcal antigen IsaB family protein n=1 Tax=Staphylococcus caeli TaxID=2201815 RepID=UPI003F55440A
MNKIAKTFVAGSIVLGTALGVSVSNVDVSQNETQAATTPYYHYDGYAGNNPSFLLNGQFKNGVKYNNVTFNGVKISSKTTGNTTIKKYDQAFSGYSKKHKTASNVNIPITRNLTYSQVKKAYGSELHKMKEPEKKSKGSGVYYYKPSQEGAAVYFEMTNSKVTEVNIGYGGYGA